MIYVGIDPGETKGKEGAVAIYDPKYNFMKIEWCPQTREAMVEILTEYNIQDLHVTIEKAPKKMMLPRKNGKRTVHHPTVLYGNFQAWCGILATLNIKYQLKYDIVHPRTWQTILQKNKKLSTKERSMERVLRLYPEAIPFLTKYRGERKYNAADSINIMDYGRIKIWMK